MLVGISAFRYYGWGPWNHLEQQRHQVESNTLLFLPHDPFSVDWRQWMSLVCEPVFAGLELPSSNAFRHWGFLGYGKPGKVTGGNLVNANSFVERKHNKDTIVDYSHTSEFPVGLKCAARLTLHWVLYGNGWPRRKIRLWTKLGGDSGETVPNYFRTRPNV